MTLIEEECILEHRVSRFQTLKDCDVVCRDFNSKIVQDVGSCIWRNDLYYDQLADQNTDVTINVVEEISQQIGMKTMRSFAYTRRRTLDHREK